MQIELKGKQYDFAADWLAVKLWEQETGKNAFTTYLDPKYQKSATDVITFAWACICSAAKAAGQPCEVSVDDVGSSMKFNSPVMISVLKAMNNSMGEGLENPSQPETMSQKKEKESPSDGMTSSVSPSANLK